MTRKTVLANADPALPGPAFTEASLKQIARPCGAIRIPGGAGGAAIAAAADSPAGTFGEAVAGRRGGEWRP